MKIDVAVDQNVKTNWNLWQEYFLREEDQGLSFICRVLITLYKGSHCSLYRESRFECLRSANLTLARLSL